MWDTFVYTTPGLYEKMKMLRREIHRYPETAWTEYRTSWLVAKELSRAGFQVYLGQDVCRPDSRMGLPSPEVLLECEKRAESEGAPSGFIEKIRGGKTGVAGVLRGEKPGPVRVLRFDIDALPIQEESTDRNREYRSRHVGVMHACGHDGHTAAGIGAACILGRERKRLSGEVRLIFQPAEEGCRGARAVIDQGWLRGAESFFSGHIGMGAERLGEIAACTEGFLATSKLDLHFQGKAAHAAKAPESGRNALLAAAVCTVNAYAISRNGQGEGRINIGRFSGGSGRNIIADDAYLEAETRGENGAVNQYMRDSLRRVAQASADMYGVACEILNQGEAGTAASSPELARRCRRAAEGMGMGAGYCEQGSFHASEDAADLMQKVQEEGGEAAYFLFGTPLAAEHHQPGFDFDEKVLAVMAEFYSRILLDF